MNFLILVNAVLKLNFLRFLREYRLRGGFAVTVRTNIEDMFTMRKFCISLRTMTLPVHSCTPAGLHDLSTVAVPISTLAANAGTIAATMSVNHIGPLRRTSRLQACTTVSTYPRFKKLFAFIETCPRHGSTNLKPLRIAPAREECGGGGHAADCPFDRGRREGCSQINVE